MEHKPYYRHRELMNELSIKTNQLPDDLKTYVIKFNQKIRFAKNPEIIQDCQNFSELIADEIENWYDSQEITHSNEPVEPVEPVEPAEPIEPIEPVQKVEPVEPVEKVEPVQNVEPTQPIESKEETNDWGLNLNW